MRVRAAFATGRFHAEGAPLTTAKDFARPTWCRHHSAPHPLEHECAVGVDIVKLVPRGTFGGFYALPCHTATSDGIAKCECAQRSLFTTEEVAAQDAERAAWIKEATRRMELTLPLIGKIKGRYPLSGARGSNNNDVRTGVETCPVCGLANGLAWSLAGSNGHIAMKCATTDCIAFME